jgi:hypothetical protein
MNEMDQMKPATLLKVRQIDQELKTEFYKILDDRGEERPNIGTKPEDVPDMIHKQYEQKKFETEARNKIKQQNYKEAQDVFKQEMEKERDEALEKNPDDKYVINLEESDEELESKQETEHEFQKKL